MGAAEAAAGLEEAPEQPCGDRERRVGYDVIGLAGKAEITRVGVDDDHAVTEAGPQGAGALGV